MPRPLSFLRKNAKDAKSRSNIASASTIQRHEELTAQQHLPHELLLHIFSYVRDRNDIVTLCRSSKALRSVAEDFLYRVINLDFSGRNGNSKKAFQLLEAIQNPRFSNVIMEVRVELQPCIERIDRDKGEGPPTKCVCGTIDQMLGAALRSMRLLEVLSINCSLCMNLAKGRHHYLPDLDISHLRELCYECHCTMGNGFDPIKLFMAPWAQSLIALNWRATLWTTIPQETLSKLLRSRQILPNLNTLHYTDTSMCDELLAKRTISRLSTGYIDPTTKIVAQSDKKSMTHIILSEYSVKAFLGGVGNVSQFINLQHIGTLPLARNSFGSHPPTMPDLVDSALNSIESIQHLKSINFCMRLLKPEENPWDMQLLTRLEFSHPKLCRIYVSGDHHFIWTLGGSLRVWEKRNLPVFTSWDILTGRYEKN